MTRTPGASKERESANASVVRASRISSKVVRQLGNVARDVSSLVHGEHLGNVSISPGLAAIDVGEGLAVSVFHFEAAGDLLNSPGWWKAASVLFKHGRTLLCKCFAPKRRLFRRWSVFLLVSWRHCQMSYRDAAASGRPHRRFVWACCGM